MRPSGKKAEKGGVLCSSGLSPAERAARELEDQRFEEATILRAGRRADGDEDEDD